MNTIEKLMALRHCRLFKDLSAEAILSIAEEAQSCDMYKGQKIYSAGEPADALYILVSGSVAIMNNEKMMANIEPGGFFGILSLLDSSLLTADAIAQSDGLLIYIDKITFDKITDDLPEIFKMVTKVIIDYFREKT